MLTEFTHEPYPRNVFVLLSEFEGLRLHFWLSKNLSLMHQPNFHLYPKRMFNKILIKIKFPLTKLYICYPEDVTGGVLSLGDLMLFPWQFGAGISSFSSVWSLTLWYCCWTWLLCQM